MTRPLFPVFGPPLLGVYEFLCIWTGNREIKEDKMNYLPYLSRWETTRIKIMDSDELTGLIASFLAAVSFGSYGVPMKGEAATRVDVDPLVFQTYKAVTVFVSCNLPYSLQPPYSFHELAGI